jgi:hypothetical protein
MIREADPVRQPDALWSSELGQDGRHGLFIRCKDDRDIVALLT